MLYQRTLKRAVRFTGVGLHSGSPIELIVKPARANQGISFVRTDLEGSPSIQANYRNVSNTQMATVLGRGRITVSTVEHLLAALAGLGIDNAVVEVGGPEVPILDGSAAPFCKEIMSAGIQAQLQDRPFLALRRRVEVRSEGKWASAEPAQRLEIHASIDWEHPAIGYQEFHYVEGKTMFGELAGARTFGFLRDVEALKRMGLARGGSLENAVVLDDSAVLNPDGLRYPDEFVRHKVLDAIGDLKLAGISIQGYIRLHRAGHDLHSQLVAEIFRDPANYEILDGSSLVREQVQQISTAVARRLAAV
jgi:UDP-3-O-[3-hydroxymyristoyl] N-acetylglucosamine deacetylase